MVVGFSRDASSIELRSHFIHSQREHICKASHQIDLDMRSFGRNGVVRSGDAKQNDRRKCCRERYRSQAIEETTVKQMPHHQLHPIFGLPLMMISPFSQVVKVDFYYAKCNS